MTAGIDQEFIEFSRTITWQNLPCDTKEILRLSLLDWLAVGAAGTDEPVSIALRQLGLSEAGNQTASVFGKDPKFPTRMAAMINGATSHALDYDDTHFLHIGHPSVVIFPAVLAMAQQVDATGQEMLEAALVGIETSIRIGQWLGRAHYQAGFHMTATAGCFGAALGAGRLLGLDKSQMKNALGLAATRASGLKSQFGTMGKPFNAGMAAANGIEAVLLAKAGLVSEVDGLESFASTHAGEFIDRIDVLNGLGNTFVIQTINHKFHACCHGIHATLEALAQISVDAAEITSVAVTVHPRWLNVCNKPAPTTGLEAKFSIAQSVAMAVSGLDTGVLATFNDANCFDPDLVRLRDMVKVSGDADMADGAAKVEILCGSGMGRKAAFDLAAPLNITTCRAKVLTKAKSLVCGGHRQLEETVAGLEKAQNLDAIAAFVSRQR